VQSAGNLYLRFNKNEDDAEYQELMKQSLTSMSSEEKGIQRRNENTGYMAFFYKASEKVIGKSQLGSKIELLCTEFSDRFKGKGLEYV